MTDDPNLRLIKTAHDLPTLFRVLPWIFLIGDQRDPAMLVKAALTDAKGFLDSHVSDESRDRRALMRGLAINWFQSMGAPINPAHIEAIVGLVAQAVDAVIDAERKPDLSGEEA